MNRTTLDSKNKIYKAALNLFIKKGIKGTTTREIAKKAGIAEGTIYIHFSSKDAIAFTLFKNYMGVFRKRLLESSKNCTDPTFKLSALIHAFFDFAKDEPNACSYIVIGHYTELNKMTKEKNKFKDIFVEVIHDGIKKRVFRKIDENLGSALIIGMINRAILSFNNGLLDSDYDKVVSETMNAALKVLEKKQ